MFIIVLVVSNKILFNNTGSESGELAESRLELLERAKENIIKAQQQQKKAYDQRHSCPSVYAIGSVVLKKDFTRKKRKGGKLDEKWLGPFKIEASLGRGLFRLKAIDTSSCKWCTLKAL